MNGPSSPTPSPAARIVAELRAAFESGKTKSYDWRMQQLGALAHMLDEHREDLLGALEADLGKSRHEGWLAELILCPAEAAHARKHLRSWMEPIKVPTPKVLQPAKCSVRPEPLGVALILGPWNYPLQLMLLPLIGALSAGNCAVLKPSEVAEHSSHLLAELVTRYLDQDCVRVVEGGAEAATSLLQQRFDHIFFTGSDAVARKVMIAAARHLTPVTLELGGKSPAIVERSADLSVTANRIAWGKFVNAGQTCVAPDYVLVERPVEEALLAQLIRAIRHFYGDDPRQSPDYARIINERHHQRLVRLMEGCRVMHGGEHDPASRYFAPTLLRETRVDSPVMTEEIFGPLLPVVPVDSVRDAVAFVHSRPRPLALYLFTRDRAIADQILGATSSGGACVNDAVVQLAAHELPFGGVGESGFGAYHGRQGFETFSHRRGLLDKSFKLDLELRYPPYDEQKVKWLTRLL
jgi:aldehyde dehydrogenase (NAD+)